MKGKTITMNSNADRPLVSVVIPTYNRASLLLRAIRSVLAQTYSTYEVIVVDDCSDDDMRSVLSEFTRTDSRIRVIRHERNRGLSWARNTGIEAATGQYVSFLDDDDEYLPSTLNDLVGGMRDHPEWGMVYGWVDTVDDSEGDVRIPWHRANTLWLQPVYQDAFAFTGKRVAYQDSRSPRHWRI